MNKITNLNKVLFINFGGIGDEILFFPTLQTFKAHYPNTSITLLVEPRSAGCKELTDKIDQVIKYDIKNSNKIISFIRLLGIIANNRFDAVISSGSNKFIGVLLFLSRVKIRIGYNSGWLSRKLLSNSITLNKQQYATNMYHDLLKGLGIDSDAPLPEIILPEEVILKGKILLQPLDKPLLLIHPGVSKLSIKKNIIKGWPDQKWAELIIQLLESGLYKVGLCGGPDDDKSIENIRNYLAKKELDKTNYIDLYGKTKSLLELAAIIKLSDLLLCVDSAPMHVAVGVKTKIVAIFGPTDEKKLLPENKDFIAVRNTTLNCRPCLWDKRNYVCDQPSCLDISVQQMLDVINALQI
ncbi:MAG: glycosyltransferase family 9 protein [Cyanobacteriota bacterium]